MLKIAVIGARGLPATYGGVEKACEELYSRFAKNGYEIILYGRKYYSKNNQKDYRGIKLINLFVPNIKGFETLYHSFISTVHATFSDADIIHFHAQGPTIFSWIPRIFAPKKLVGFTCHGIDWQRDKWSRIARLVIKLGEFASAKFPHFRIGVSQYLVDYYKQKYDVGLYRIYNGIDLIPSVPIKSINSEFGLYEKDYFIFVGRLVPEKAPDILIKAFKQLKTDKKLAIIGGSAGTDDYLTYLKELSKDDERVIFTSYAYGETLHELFSNAVAYVSASKLEGLPITMLEAMSFSLPVILSDIGPHLEPLSYNNKAGITFSVNNIDACKTALEQFLCLSVEEQKNMGQVARNTVIQNFEWDEVYKQTLLVYKNSF